MNLRVAGRTQVSSSGQAWRHRQWITSCPEQGAEDLAQPFSWQKILPWLLWPEENLPLPTGCWAEKLLCPGLGSLILSLNCGTGGLSFGRAGSCGKCLEIDVSILCSSGGWHKQSTNVPSFVLAVGKQVCSQKGMLRRLIQGKVMVPTMRCQDLLKTWRKTRRSFSGS